MSWKEPIVLARPQGRNDSGENKGGLVIYIKDGPSGREEEVAAIAFDRDEGERETAFNETVDHAVEIAEKAISTIKDLFAKAGQLQ